MSERLRAAINTVYRRLSVAPDNGEPPIEGEAITTEAGERITTEDGDIIITEPAP